MLINIELHICKLKGLLDMRCKNRCNKCGNGCEIAAAMSASRLKPSPPKGAGGPPGAAREGGLSYNAFA